ncbi:MAG TPA: T9SS type A sorting domain-containing protein [Bacteroidales bacterium]|nr:T9SS type A sorting domain-containing protein [Bacteroidales bacterium]
MALLTRILFSSGIVLLLSTAIFSQEYLISQGGSISTCSGTLYDSGGVEGDSSAFIGLANGNIQNEEYAKQNKLKPCQTYRNTITCNIDYATPDSNFVNICKGTEVIFDSNTEFYNNQQEGYTQTNETTIYIWQIYETAHHQIAQFSGHGMQQLIYPFNAPGSYIVELTSIDINGCPSDEPVEILVRVSVAPNFAGTFINPTIICPGQQVFLHGQVNSNPWQVSSSIGLEVNSCINDTSVLTNIIPVYLSNLASQATITNTTDILSVCLTLEHSYIGDLNIILICPNGSQVNLHEMYNCNNAYFGIPNHADNCIPGTSWDYCWSMSASQQITSICSSGQSIPSGTYLPMDSFSSLNGCPINGNWRIIIDDHFGADDGTLVQASINFNTDLLIEGDLWSYENTIDTTESSTSVYWSGNGMSQNFGTDYWVAPFGWNTVLNYTFNVIDDFECHYDTTLLLLVRNINNPLCCASPEPNICYISTNNQFETEIFWNNPTEFLDSVFIYREMNGNNVKIASLPFGSNQFNDVLLAQIESPPLYRISFLNPCFQETAQSDYHQNILLKIVALNESVVNLEWNNYFGLQYSEIELFRGISPDNLTHLATLSESTTSYTDSNLPDYYDYLYYQIKFNSTVNCNSHNESINIYSNIATTDPEIYSALSLNKHKTQFTLSPNPARNSVFVSFTAPNARLSICDLNGKKLIVKNDFTGGEINIENLKAGVYVVKLETDEGISSKKLIVNP